MEIQRCQVIIIFPYLLFCLILYSIFVRIPKSLKPCPLSLPLYSQQIITCFTGNMNVVGWEHVCFLLLTLKTRPHIIHSLLFPSSHLEKLSSGSRDIYSIRFFLCLIPSTSLMILSNQRNQQTFLPP